MNIFSWTVRIFLNQLLKDPETSDLTRKINSGNYFVESFSKVLSINILVIFNEF